MVGFMVGLAVGLAVGFMVGLMVANVIFDQGHGTRDPRDPREQ